MINFIEGLNFSDFMLIVVAILLLIGYIPQLKKQWDSFHFETGWSKTSEIKEKEQGEKIKKLEEKLNALEIKVDSTANQFLNDQQKFHCQSIDIRNELAESIDRMAERQDELIKRVDDLAEQNRKYELDDIRETLIKAYNYYTNPKANPNKMWTKMEAHAFWEQYNNYTDRRGNSYVVDTVAPAMHCLEVIDMDDYTKIAELMESRHVHRY